MSRSSDVASVARRMAQMFLRVPALLVWFVVLWVALWGDLTWANLLSGIAVSLGVVVFTRLPDTRFGSYGATRIRPFRSLWFLIYFAYKVFQANVLLAWEVVTPRNTIRPGILGIPLSDCSDALITMIANAFTLTPGSLTIEVRSDPADDTGPADGNPGHRSATIYVHVLHLHDPEKVRSDLFNLAELAVRAFGSDEALGQFRDRSTQPSTAAERPS